MQVLFNGLGTTSYYVLFCMGLTLVFGIMRVINFAHGELFTLGVFLFWWVYTMGSNLFPLPVLLGLGLGLAVLAFTGIGLALERGLFRPLRQRPFSSFLASVGLVYILQTLIAESPFGRIGRSIPPMLPGVMKFGGGVLSYTRLLLIIMAIVLTVGLWFFLGRTKYGRMFRATAQDPEAAALQGVNINRVSAMTLGLGSALAGLSGVLMSSEMTLTPYLGDPIMWKAFIIVIVGGLGSIEGTIVASALFGFLDSAIYVLGDPKFIAIISPSILLAVLALRPQGLLGREKIQ